MRDTIRNKIKSFFAFLIILFLLPYIISVFINGKNAVQGADSDNASVYLAEMLAGASPCRLPFRSRPRGTPSRRVRSLCIFPHLF